MNVLTVELTSVRNTIAGSPPLNSCPSMGRACRKGHRRLMLQLEMVPLPTYHRDVSVETIGPARTPTRFGGTVIARAVRAFGISPSVAHGCGDLKTLDEEHAVDEEARAYMRTTSDFEVVCACLGRLKLALVAQGVVEGTPGGGTGGASKHCLLSVRV